MTESTDDNLAMALKARTLFVLGAGASKEVGLPTGYELKHRLAKRLDIRFADGWSQSSGDRSITDALKALLQKRDDRRGDINPYLHKAWQMVAALPQAISIDNYIDAIEDPDVALLGKLAIAREILDSEKGSSLHFKEPDERQAMVQRVENTFYHGLFQLLSEGFRRSNCEAIFDNVAFVSFNYDRSMEWYLNNALQNYFGIDAHTSAEICLRLNIIHPYGTVGKLPGAHLSRGGVPYGGGYQNDYVDIAASIRTFTEQIEDATLSDAIEAQVTSADHIVFLGFGFHDINMETLATKQKTVLRRVFGTALGVSKSDIAAIESGILGSFADANRNPVFHSTQRIELRSDLKCAAIFSEYARSLRQ